MHGKELEHQKRLIYRKLGVTLGFKLRGREIQQDFKTT